MLTCAHITRATVAKISAQEKQRIKDFIQGSVYCYCKNNKGETFAARDLFGGSNPTGRVRLYTLCMNGISKTGAAIQWRWLAETSAGCFWKCSSMTAGHLKSSKGIPILTDGYNRIIIGVSL